MIVNVQLHGSHG